MAEKIKQKPDYSKCKDCELHWKHANGLEMCDADWECIEGLDGWKIEMKWKLK